MLVVVRDVVVWVDELGAVWHLAAVVREAVLSWLDVWGPGGANLDLWGGLR